MPHNPAIFILAVGCGLFFVLLTDALWDWKMLVLLCIAAMITLFAGTIVLHPAVLMCTEAALVIGVSSYCVYKYWRGED